MTRYYKLTYWLIATLTLFIACRKDNSSLDTNLIPGVTIDTSGQSAFDVFQFEHLAVSPTIITDIAEKDLTYEWRINLDPRDTLYTIIGAEKDLDFEVAFKPNVTGYSHQLVLTVTDQNTGLQYIMAWPVTVKNNIGEGLVIAETTDGTTTDLSHIMSPEVTSGYSSQSVKHHVYSSINGNTIPGLIKQMRFITTYGVDALYGITDASIVRVNTLDYTYAGMNDDLFYSARESYHPQSLGAIYQGDMYVGENRLTGTYMGVSQKFGIPVDFDAVVPDEVGFNPGNTSDINVRINFYDEVNEHFVYQPGIATYLDHSMHIYEPVSNSVFDPADVPDKENLAAGANLENDFLHLLKDKTTGEVSLYVFDKGSFVYPDILPPSPKALYDFSAAPEINEATHFVILDDQKVIYYATDTRIYAILYGGSTPVFEERYTVPAGEAITTLQIYQQVGYPVASGPYIETNNQQLILSTYGTEGKVYLLPMKNAGVGNIDAANIKTFGGFGRITAIAPQK